MRILLLALLMQLDAPLDDCPEQHSTCLESCRVDFGMERERKKLTACVETCEAKQANCERGKAQDLDELQKAREALAKPDLSASPAEVKRVESAPSQPLPADAPAPAAPAPTAPPPEASRGPVHVEIMRDPPPTPEASVPAPAAPAPAASEEQRKQSIDAAFDQEPAPAPAPAKAPAGKKK